MQSPEDAVVQQVLKFTREIEEEVDSSIKMLDNAKTGEEIDALRQKRLDALKKESLKKVELLSMGHGKYGEIAGEKEFFSIIKQSEKVILHFYRTDTPRCKIFDHHLKLLAPKHIEARFIRIDANKTPFLTDKLEVHVLPTLIIIIKNQIKDRIVGFTDLGNCDDYPTEMLEWRLAQSEVINYDGDLLHPPDLKKKSGKKPITGIRRSKYNDFDSDSD